jgi:predicted CoA-substrate-specific enzyme activase
MILAGCDVGSLSAEAVLMKDGKIIAAEIIRVRPRPEQSAREVMDKVLQKASLSYSDIEYCVSTGYGREKIPFANSNISEISCHGKGAHWLVPSARTVIDVGGQDCKAIRIDDSGKLVNFVMNDKCAAGTGRFLEFMAKTLGVSIEELGPLALNSEERVAITNVCSIFAESEVLHYIYEGKKATDIASGINYSMAGRINSLVRRVGIEKDLCITGGVAKNVSVIKNLEELLGLEPRKLPVDPQIVGALGACLFAEEGLSKQKR